MTDIAGALRGQSPDNVIRTGTVRRATPLVLDIAGGSVTDAGSLALVNIGDTVACVRQGETWLVLGVITPASANYGVMAGVRGFLTVTLPSGGTTVSTVHNPWSLPKPPTAVFLNMATRPVASANWTFSATAYTVTGFTSVGYGPAPGANTNVRLDYLALL